MANFESIFRTNYFNVKDEQAFIKFAESCGIQYWTDHENKMFACGAYSATPSEMKIDEENTIEIDFEKELAKHLQDGQVAVIIEVGNEKLRYINRFATAINNKGKTKYLSLDGIYKMAKKLGDVTL